MPFSTELDPNQKHEMRTLIRDMAPEKAILISTHILEEVGAVCTRAVIIARGRIVADGTPEELEARAPNHNAVFISAPAQTLRTLAPILRELDGVAEVSLGDNSLYARPRAGIEIYDDIQVLVRQRNLLVNEIRLERGQLDDVFRAVTTGEALAGTAGPETAED